jgi:hypothetical protein
VKWSKKPRSDFGRIEKSVAEKWVRGCLESAGRELQRSKRSKEVEKRCRAKEKECLLRKTVHEIEAKRRG